MARVFASATLGAALVATEASFKAGGAVGILVDDSIDAVHWPWEESSDSYP